MSEDIVSFVDGIWGSKTAAGKTQDVRMEKAKLDKLKEERQTQLQLDSEKRVMLRSNQNIHGQTRRH